MATKVLNQLPPFKYSDFPNSSTLVLNSEAIKQSLENIVKIRKGELLNYRDFGTTIHNYLHELSFVNTRFMLVSLQREIAQQEPRVEVLPDTDVTIDYENRRYVITISVKLKETLEKIDLTIFANDNEIYRKR